MARVLNSIIDRLDVSKVLESYKGGGNSCFHPRMMLKVMIYAYLNNIYSSRKIERQLQEHIHYMWLSGGARPDFRTINMFHQEQKRKYKKNAFLMQNLFYNRQGNYYICPMGQHLSFIREEKRKSDAGYISQVSIYRAAKCVGCPVRGLCNKAMGNRQIEVNHTLNQYKEKIRYL